MNSVSGENKLHKLALSGRSYSIAKGQIIQSSDDRYRSLINIVKSGYVKRYEILADGSLSIQAVYGPMEVFPLTLAFRELANTEVYEGPEIIHYQAITNVELVSIDASKLTEAVNNDPTIYKDVLRETGIRTHSNIQRLENLSLKSSYKRLAHQLVYLARRFGEPTPNGIKIRVQLTHQDLADILSLTRETVSVNILRLYKKKLIIIGQHITVPDIKKLEDEAHGHNLVRGQIKVDTR